MTLQPVSIKRYFSLGEDRTLSLGEKKGNLVDIAKKIKDLNSRSLSDLIQLRKAFKDRYKRRGKSPIGAIKRFFFNLRTKSFIRHLDKAILIDIDLENVRKLATKGYFVPLLNSIDAFKSLGDENKSYLSFYLDAHCRKDSVKSENTIKNRENIIEKLLKGDFQDITEGLLRRSELIERFPEIIFEGAWCTNFSFISISLQNGETIQQQVKSSDRIPQETIQGAITAAQKLLSQNMSFKEVDNFIQSDHFHILETLSTIKESEPTKIELLVSVIRTKHAFLSKKVTNASWYTDLVSGRQCTLKEEGEEFTFDATETGIGLASKTFSKTAFLVLVKRLVLFSDWKRIEDVFNLSFLLDGPVEKKQQDILQELSHILCEGRNGAISTVLRAYYIRLNKNLLLQSEVDAAKEQIKKAIEIYIKIDSKRSVGFFLNPFELDELASFSGYPLKIQDETKTVKTSRQIASPQKQVAHTERFKKPDVFGPELVIYEEEFSRRQQNLHNPESIPQVLEKYDQFLQIASDIVTSSDQKRQSVDSAVSDEYSLLLNIKDKEKAQQEIETIKKRNEEKYNRYFITLFALLPDTPPTLNQILIYYAQERLEEIVHYTDEQLEKIKEAIANLLSAQQGIQKCQRLEKEITSKDTFSGLSAELVRSGRCYKDPLQQPYLQVFEVFLDTFARPNQVEVISQLKDANKSAIVQLLMGGGKTYLLLPLLGFIRANGENIASIMFSDALLQDQVHALHQKLGTSFKSIIYVLPELGVQSTLKDLKSIYEHIVLIQKARGIFIYSPKRKHALINLLPVFLKEAFSSSYSIDNETAVINEKQEEVQQKLEQLLQILTLLKEYESVLGDEVDTLLKPSLQYIITQGQAHLFNQQHAKAITQVALYIIFSEITSSYFIQDSNYRQNILPRVVDFICGEFFKDDNNVPNIKTILEIYKKTEENKEKCEHAEEIFNRLEGNKQQFILALRSTIHTVLPQVLSSYINSEYGICLDQDTPVARPFQGPGVPTTTQFSSPIEQLVRSIFALKQQGIPQPIFEKKYPSSQEKSIDATGYDALQKSAPTIGNQDKFQEFILSELAPKIAVYPEHISSTAQHLFSSAHSFSGISGTLWNTSAFPIFEDVHPDYQQEVASLLNIGKKSTGSSQHITISKKEKNHTHEESLLAEITKNTNARCIIDTGGWLKDTKVTQFIQEIFKRRSEITSIVFHNEKGELVRVIRTTETTLYDFSSGQRADGQKGEKIAIIEDDPATRFTIYGQPYVTGTDIKQIASAHGILTLWDKMILRDFQQSIFRLRQIQEGQSCSILYDDIFEQSLAKTISVASSQEPITFPRLVRYLITTQENKRVQENYTATHQRMKDALETRIRSKFFEYSKELRTKQGKAERGRIFEKMSQLFASSQWLFVDPEKAHSIGRWRFPQDILQEERIEQDIASYMKQFEGSMALIGADSEKILKELQSCYRREDLPPHLESSFEGQPQIPKHTVIQHEEYDDKRIVLEIAVSQKEEVISLREKMELGTTGGSVDIQDRIDESERKSRVSVAQCAQDIIAECEEAKLQVPALLNEMQKKDYDFSAITSYTQQIETVQNGVQQAIAAKKELAETLNSLQSTLSDLQENTRFGAQEYAEEFQQKIDNLQQKVDSTTLYTAENIALFLREADEYKTECSQDKLEGFFEEATSSFTRYSDSVKTIQAELKETKEYIKRVEELALSLQIELPGTISEKEAQIAEYLQKLQQQRESVSYKTLNLFQNYVEEVRQKKREIDSFLQAQMVQIRSAIQLKKDRIDRSYQEEVHGTHISVSSSLFLEEGSEEKNVEDVLKISQQLEQEEKKLIVFQKAIRCYKTLQAFSVQQENEIQRQIALKILSRLFQTTDGLITHCEEIEKVTETIQDQVNVPSVESQIEAFYRTISRYPDFEQQRGEYRRQIEAAQQRRRDEKQYEENHVSLMNIVHEVIQEQKQLHDIVKNAEGAFLQWVAEKCNTAQQEVASSVHRIIKQRTQLEQDIKAETARANILLTSLNFSSSYSVESTQHDMQTLYENIQTAATEEEIFDVQNRLAPFDTLLQKDIETFRQAKRKLDEREEEQKLILYERLKAVQKRANTLGIETSGLEIFGIEISRHEYNKNDFNDFDVSYVTFSQVQKDIELLERKCEEKQQLLDTVLQNIQQPHGEVETTIQQQLGTFFGYQEICEYIKRTLQDLKDICSTPEKIADIDSFRSQYEAFQKSISIESLTARMHTIQERYKLAQTERRQYEEHYEGLTNVMASLESLLQQIPQIDTSVFKESLRSLQTDLQTLQKTIDDPRTLHELGQYNGTIVAQQNRISEIKKKVDLFEQELTIALQNKIAIKKAAVQCCYEAMKIGFPATMEEDTIHSVHSLEERIEYYNKLDKADKDIQIVQEKIQKLAQLSQRKSRSSTQKFVAASLQQAIPRDANVSQIILYLHSGIEELLRIDDANDVQGSVEEALKQAKGVQNPAIQSIYSKLQQLLLQYEKPMEGESRKVEDVVTNALNFQNQITDTTEKLLTALREQKHKENSDKIQQSMKEIKAVTAKLENSIETVEQKRAIFEKIPDLLEKGSQTAVYLQSIRQQSSQIQTKIAEAERELHTLQQEESATKDSATLESRLTDIQQQIQEQTNLIDASVAEIASQMSRVESYFKEQVQATIQNLRHKANITQLVLDIPQSYNEGSYQYWDFEAIYEKLAKWNNDIVLHQEKMVFDIRQSLATLQNDLNSRKAIPQSIQPILESAKEEVAKCIQLYNGPVEAILSEENLAKYRTVVEQYSSNAMDEKIASYRNAEQQYSITRLENIYDEYLRWKENAIKDDPTQRVELYINRLESHQENQQHLFEIFKEKCHTSAAPSEEVQEYTEQLENFCRKALQEKDEYSALLLTVDTALASVETILVQQKSVEDACAILSDIFHHSDIVQKQHALTEKAREIGVAIQTYKEQAKTAPIDTLKEASRTIQHNVETLQSQHNDLYQPIQELFFKEQQRLTDTISQIDSEENSVKIAIDEEKPVIETFCKAGLSSLSEIDKPLLQSAVAAINTKKGDILRQGELYTALYQVIQNSIGAQQQALDEQLLSIDIQKTSWDYVEAALFQHGMSLLLHAELEKILQYAQQESINAVDYQQQLVQKIEEVRTQTHLLIQKSQSLLLATSDIQKDYTVFLKENKTNLQDIATDINASCLLLSDELQKVLRDITQQYKKTDIDLVQILSKRVEDTQRHTHDLRKMHESQKVYIEALSSLESISWLAWPKKFKPLVDFRREKVRRNALKLFEEQQVTTKEQLLTIWIVSLLQEVGNVTNYTVYDLKAVRDCMRGFFQTDEFQALLQIDIFAPKKNVNYLTISRPNFGEYETLKMDEAFDIMCAQAISERWKQTDVLQPNEIADMKQIITSIQESCNSRKRPLKLGEEEFKMVADTILEMKTEFMDIDEGGTL